MSKRKLDPKAIALGVIVVGILAYWLSSQPVQEIGSLPGQEPLPLTITAQTPETTTSVATAIGESSGSASGGSEATGPNVTPSDEAEILHQAEQQKIVTGFKLKTMIEMALPKGMDYRELDLGDQAVALLGEDTQTGRQYAAIASYQTPGPEGAIKLLLAEKESLPLLKDSNYAWDGKPQTFDSPADSGLGQVTVIAAGEKNGQALYAAYVERTDKKGAYLFLLQAKKESFSSSDEELEGLLNSLKVK